MLRDFGGPVRNLGAVSLLKKVICNVKAWGWLKWMMENFSVDPIWLSVKSFNLLTYYGDGPWILVGIFFLCNFSYRDWLHCFPQTGLLSVSLLSCSGGQLQVKELEMFIFGTHFTCLWALLCSHSSHWWDENKDPLSLIAVTLFGSHQ